MSVPSLQKTALLSFSLHFTAFLLILLILRQSNRIIIPQPYTVNLVSPGASHRISKEKIEDITRESEKTVAPSESPAKSTTEKAEEPELVKKKIAVLQQKRKVENEIAYLEAKKKRIAELQKHQSISVKSASGKHGVPMSSAQIKESDEYYSKITKEIWDQWYCPPQICKNGLQAVIAIRIFKDGAITIQGIEKSSGNVLFDRYALKAIKKATPLSPPPSEMEINVRFL